MTDYKQLHADIDQCFIDIGRYDRDLDELDRLSEIVLNGVEGESVTDVESVSSESME